MKLTVIGGGGVRSPFLAQIIARKAKDLHIDKVVFMDNDPRKLQIYGTLSEITAMCVEPELDFAVTADAAEALKDADFIITTVRVGGDAARVKDERIALKYGVLGQETTGAGGFAMAMRSVPVILDYCRMVKELSKPGAVIFNFTNPSGLVTQVVRDEGYDNFYGICDGPSEFLQEIANMMNVPREKIHAECFGLNHLSWFRSVKADGEEIIDKILSNPLLFKETENRLFDPDLVKDMGMLLNGYLYYYYHREKAIENIDKTGRTRGETILEINRRMTEALSGIKIGDNFPYAVRTYLEYMEQRKNSYMAIESGSGPVQPAQKHGLDSLLNSSDEGYAGVALGVIEGISAGKTAEAILSVPNNGAIVGLEDKDVVEITCRIQGGNIEPVKIGKVPDIQMSLIRQVKLYERLAAKAIRECNIKTAIYALMVHPLVNSYSLAKKIVYEYIEAHKEHIGNWS